MADARRDTVFARLRRGLGRGAQGPEPAAVRDRLADPPRATVPKRGQLPRSERLVLFADMVEASRATLARVGSTEAVPGAVADWCRDHNQPLRAVIAPGSPLAELAWPDAQVDVEARLVRSGDMLAVSTATAGIAETGTLAVCSGPENPVTASFLPDGQVIVVNADDVVGTPEDYWAAQRQRGPLPRTVHWITGPSRSGDIEMTMLMGAHGPIRVHVVLVGA